MLRVLRDATYRRLFSAQVLALVGTGLLTVALGLLAFDIAGDAAGSVLGAALTIKMVAYVAVAPVIAALVDRLPKKAVLIGSDAVRIVIALLLPFVTEAWQIYVLVFLLQSASATFTPAFQSLIPAVLPRAVDYTRALTLSRLAYDLEALLSPAIAALLLTVVGPGDLFVGTAIGFACSMVLVAVTRLPGRDGGAATSSFWRRLTLGARVFVRTPTLRFLLLTNVVVAAGTAIVLVNSVVYARGVFGLDASALAMALGTYGVGSLGAALTVPAAVARLGVVRTMAAGTITIAVALVAAVVITAIATTTGTGWIPLLASWLLLGIGTSLVNTPSARLLADASTPTDRNLVYTAQFALSHACFLVAYPIAGWVGAISLTGAATALCLIAGIATAAAILYAHRRALGGRAPTARVGSIAGVHAGRMTGSRT